MDVGIFFKVSNDFLIDSVALEAAEPYGEAIQYGGHYDFHEYLHPAQPAERRFKSHAYDFYPRGRVVFFPSRNVCRVYVDPCLTKDDINRVIVLFRLEGQTVEIAGDEHYRCSICNKSYLD
jgi:hypothetical protein